MATLDLPLDVGGEVVRVHDAHAAGVDELEEPSAGLDEGGDAVAGDAGGRIDDADAPAGEPVEQRRLADVRPADDRDDWQATWRTHRITNTNTRRPRRASRR